MFVSTRRATSPPSSRSRSASTQQHRIEGLRYTSTCTNTEGRSTGFAPQSRTINFARHTINSSRARSAVLGARSLRLPAGCCRVAHAHRWPNPAPLGERHEPILHSPPRDAIVTSSGDRHAIAPHQDFSALGGTRTPNLLIRSRRQYVRRCSGMFVVPGRGSRRVRGRSPTAVLNRRFGYMFGYTADRDGRSTSDPHGLVSTTHHLARIHPASVLDPRAKRDAPVAGDACLNRHPKIDRTAHAHRLE